MSRLEELMEELCPDGVEYRKLGDCAKILIGEFVRKDKQSDNGIYPVYNGGVSNTGYYDECNRSANRIIVSARGANAGFVNRVFKPFWSGNSCYTIELFVEDADWNFLYYYLKSKEKRLIDNQQKGGIPAVSKKQLIEFKIPVPPLEAQREIVRILGNFTELTTELTEELTARKQQYEYYTGEMLMFHDDKVTYLKLGECCHMEKGNSPIQKTVSGKYPLVVTTSERKTSNKYQFDKPSVCIPLISSRGHGVASLNQIYYQEGKFALGNILCAVTPNDENLLCAKFLYYYLNYKKDYLLVPLMKGGANVSMTVDSLKYVKIPVPTLETQYKIVEELNKLDTLCNDASFGLPAEIEARQKQYEYYRDKLLTFKEKTA